ncbi:unnamed protein product [Gordionus sp. m RMFG-2023]
MDTSKDIFTGIKYYFVGNIQNEETLADILDKHGGKRYNYLTGCVSHVIAEINSENEPELEEANDIHETYIVLPSWISLSHYSNTLLPYHPFLVTKNKLFNNLKFMIDNHNMTLSLEKSDIDIIWALVTYNGGTLIKSSSSKNIGERPISITHLISDFPSLKQDSLRNDYPHVDFSHKGGLNDFFIVTPDWLIDCACTNSIIPYEKYNPRYLVKQLDIDSKIKESNVSSFENPALCQNIRNENIEVTRDEYGGVGKDFDANDRNKYDIKGSEKTINEQLTKIITDAFPPTQDDKTCSYLDLSQTEIPVNLNLLGCIFYIDDYNECIPSHILQSWKKVINQYGGEIVESMNQNYTHFLSSTRTDNFKKALSCNRRCISAHWLNDCVSIKAPSLPPPWKFLHLPLPLNFSARKYMLEKHVISITNFLDGERIQVKHMIWRAGAKYTGGLNQSNTLLICKSKTGSKVEKALQWKIPIVNIEWLIDFLLTQEEQHPQDFPDINDTKYQNYPDKFLDDDIAAKKDECHNYIFFDYSRFLDLMAPWEQPIFVDQEIVKDKCIQRISKSHINPLTPSDIHATIKQKVAKNDFISKPTLSDIDLNIDAKSRNYPEYTPKFSNSFENESDRHKKRNILGPLKQKRLLESAIIITKKMAISNNAESLFASFVPKKEKIMSPNKNNNSNHSIILNGSNCLTELNSSNKYLVMVTGHLKVKTELLNKQITNLRGEVTDNPMSCTHVIMDSIKRTLKFFCALSHCRYIVTSKWVEDSHNAGYFLDESEYILKDIDAERSYDFCLKTSLYRAQHRDLLFKNMNFYLTPNVEPSLKILKPVIESAGGTFVKQRPSTRQISLQNKDKVKLVIISCPEDISLCKDYLSQDIDLHNVELILTGLIQQNLNFEQFLINFNTVV